MGLCRRCGMEERNRPSTQKRRDSRRAYIKKKRQKELIIKAATFLAIIVGVIVGAVCIKKFSSSKERADLNKYYGIKTENQLAVVVDNEVVGAKGILVDGVPYVDYVVVRDYLNERFYVDMKENLLLYTLPQGTISARVGSNEYTLQKETKEKEYALLKMDGANAYIALDFVQEYTDIEFSVYEEPSRVMIVSDWEKTNVATVRKNTLVRVSDDRKSDILTDVSKKSIVTIIESKGRWKKVRTEDGVIGFIKASALKKEEELLISRDFKEPVYQNISKDYTINMAWHVVTNGTANSTVLETIANTKDLTTISPTWFTIRDTKGNIRSLASSQYVNYAHQTKVDVWAMVKDFDGGIGSPEETLELLGRTSNRERLISQLISEVLKYHIDGINVDFENVSKECGEHYLQFLRELSLKCRQNEIVLSVDNPVPSQYSTQYNLEEQGKIVDYVIIMGYDEHHSTSYESGPVASPAFVEKGIQDALEVVPSEKLINAIPFYTRVWRETLKTQEELDAQDGTEAAEYPYKVTSKAYGIKSIQVAIDNAGAKVKYDDNTEMNYAEWKEGETICKVWLEDADSLRTKLEMMKEYKLAGVAAWRLGFENASTWELISKYVN